MVFCNKRINYNKPEEKSHNPYFNRWFSAIQQRLFRVGHSEQVTILILIDGFLQYKHKNTMYRPCKCHNPYFNRWFSAIYYFHHMNSVTHSHNPYFNRWFSAINCRQSSNRTQRCHNPYFNRWFSAIEM